MLEQCVFGIETVLFAQRKKQKYWDTDLGHVKTHCFRSSFRYIHPTVCILAINIKTFHSSQSTSSYSPSLPLYYHPIYLLLSYLAYFILLHKGRT